jgi:nitrogen-specific signal transduction histidine kinase/CheY-like chemotaxis protein
MWLDVLVTPLAGADGAASRILCICRDVTAPKRADEELRQTAKLESLGVMAGGIAHDFNNLLTGILGNASLLSEVVLEEDRGMADDIVLAAERAADLTRQMLAFSGKGKFQICKTDLSVLVHEMLRLAKPSIERNVEIRLDLAGQCIVEGDPGQLQQVVMNLMINAAEAMEGRPGAMVVRTVPLEADSALLAGTFGARDAAAGAYVLLEVADNGKGMDDATMARIFDPFFTTKFTGRGLGLAAVSGIVRGHKGLMRVRSAPGEGTTFSVLFPCVSAAVAAAGKSLDPAKPGQGVILLADDEDIVRRIGTEVLKRAGYEVRTASDGREALEIFRACHGDIDAIVLDMTMPVMNGDDALRGIHEIDASVPVIVCSGYNEVEVIRRFTAQKVGAFLQKPYTAARLLEKVQGILGTVSV